MSEWICQLLSTKNHHRYRRVCIISKNLLLESVFYVLQSKDRSKQWNQYTHKRTYSIFTSFTDAASNSSHDFELTKFDCIFFLKMKNNQLEGISDSECASLLIWTHDNKIPGKLVVLYLYSFIFLSTNLWSAFLWRCVLRSHMIVCFGTNSDTHIASSCQPWVIT